MQKDECTAHEVKRAISPTRVANDTPLVGAVIDSGQRHSLTYLIAVGTIADANATFTILLEHSTDGVSFSAVDDVHLIGTEAAASFQFDDDDEVRKLGYVGPNRYTRLTITPSGNGGNADISAVAWLGAGKRN